MVYDTDKPWLTSYERYGMTDEVVFPDAHVSLVDVLERQCHKYANRTAYLCADVALTYQDLETDSRYLASYLQSIGLKKGDKVAVMLPNCLQYPILAFAILRAGLVIVNVNPLYTPTELTYQLSDSGAKALFIFDLFSKTYVDMPSQYRLPHVIVCGLADSIGQFKGLLARHLVGYRHKQSLRHIDGSTPYHQARLHGIQCRYQRPNVVGQDLALLQYTGGTTGRAKAAQLSHHNLLANLVQLKAWIQSAYPSTVAESSAWSMDNAFFEPEVQGDFDAAMALIDHGGKSYLMLTALPLYHVFSFMIGGLFGLVSGGCSLLIIDPSNTDAIIQQIKRYQPTLIAGVNTLFKALLKHRKFAQMDFSTLQLTVGGGMAVDAKVAEQWHKVTGLPIIEGYGLSEASPVVTANPPMIGAFNGMVGLPMVATDIVLLDELGNPVGMGQRGEVCILGPQVMKSYHNAPALNQDSFTKTGYFKTGDIGIMNRDGFIKLVDRIKDLILVSGFNVYPSEIEHIMNTHDYIEESAAIGIPSHERGEDPKLYVVLSDIGKTALAKQGDKVVRQTLLKYGKQNLTGYKRPRHIAFIDTLPKSQLGKIRHSELRQREGLM